MHTLILAGIIALASHHGHGYGHSTHAHHAASHSHSSTVHHSRAHKPITTTSHHRTHSVTVHHHKH